jgi:hypothetical protein
MSENALDINMSQYRKTLTIIKVMYKWNNIKTMIYTVCTRIWQRQYFM